MSQQLLLQAQIAVHGHLFIGNCLHATGAELQQHSNRVKWEQNAHKYGDAVATRAVSKKDVVGARLLSLLLTVEPVLCCQLPR